MMLKKMFKNKKIMAVMVIGIVSVSAYVFLWLPNTRPPSSDTFPEYSIWLELSGNIQNGMIIEVSGIAPTFLGGSTPEVIGRYEIDRLFIDENATQSFKSPRSAFDFVGEGDGYHEVGIAIYNNATMNQLVFGTVVLLDNKTNFEINTAYDAIIIEITIP